MAEPAESGSSAVVTIKKYANRRLYNTSTSSYVTLDHLAEMVKQGVEFDGVFSAANDVVAIALRTRILRVVSMKAAGSGC